MLTYTKLKRNRRKCVALTGLTPKEFGALLPPFVRAYEEPYPRDKTMTGKPRKRQTGGGRKGVLRETEQKLLFILVHQKTYPLQILLGELGVLPEREPQRFAQSEQPYGERPNLIIDGTERRRQRPKALEKQAAHSSGKKKTQCDKNVVIVQAQTKRVGFVSQTYAGKTHDKKIVEAEPIVYPPGTTLSQDTGFQGYAPAVEQICQPKKSRARANSLRRISAGTRRSPTCASESNMPWRE
jgi:hypothetical protein